MKISLINCGVTRCYMSKYALFLFFLFSSALVVSSEGDGWDDDREETENSGFSDEDNLYERNQDHLDWNPYDFPTPEEGQVEQGSAQSVKG